MKKTTKGKCIHSETTKAGDYNDSVINLCYCGKNLRLVTAGIYTYEEQADDSYVKVSVNALAKAWEWHRQTVNNFLEELKDLGVLSVYTESLSTFVKLNNIEEVNNSISVPSPHGERSYISEE